MKLLPFKTSLALILSFEIAFTPALAVARNVPQPNFPKVEDLGSGKYSYAPSSPEQEYDAMILRGELPNFSEDDLDPVGSRGQYARIYDRKGKILDQYFFDAVSLRRPKINYSQIRPKLVVNENGDRCLVIEATAGEDAKGQNGYVVGRIFAPRFCGLAAVHLDKEVLTLVNEDGSATLHDWGWVRSQGFRIGLWGAMNAFVPEVQGGLKGHDVRVITKTPGMKPIDWNNVVEGAVLPPLNHLGEPELADGALVIFRDGQFFAFMDYTTSRKMLLIEQVRIQMVHAMANGSNQELKRLQESLEYVKQRFDLHEQMLTEGREYGLNEAVAAMVSRMDEPAIDALDQSIQTFKKHTDRELFPYSNSVHQPIYDSIVAGARRMKERAPVNPDEVRAEVDPDSPEFDEEMLRVNWRVLLESKFQTIDQRIDTINEKTASKLLNKVLEFKTLGMILAGFGAWMYLPNAIEKSAYLRRFAVINWIYRHSPDVLKIKHEAYRDKLYASVTSLTLLTALPDLMSGASALILKTLNRATLKSNPAFAQYVRDVTAYWGDQSNWQRLATFGAQFGSKFAVTPVIRVIEDGLQQKAFLSSFQAGQVPWKKVRPEDPLGKYLGLTEPQTVGLLRPSVKGLVRKLKRSLPNVEDAEAEAWQNERLKGKYRLQAELYHRNQRRKRYARLLSTLIVAQDEGLEAADLELMLRTGIAEGGIPLAKIPAYISSERAQNNRRLIEHELYGQMSDLSFDFTHDVSFRDVDMAEMLSYGGRAKKIAVKLRDSGEFKRYTKLMRLNARETVVRIWDASLSQGQAIADANKGLVANDSVWRNMQEQFPPDHLMVSDVPAVFKVPGLPNRMDFTHPDQMAADINGTWRNLYSTGVHIQDIMFNFIMQGLQGPAMTMRQFMKKKPETDPLYQSYQDLINLVYSRRDGKLDFRLPEKTGASTDRYEGYINQESFTHALKDYYRALKKIDFGAQAKAGTKTMWETFWLYSSMQFGARWLFGGQAAGPAIIGLLFAFRASQICYKPIWWVVNATNNAFHGMKSDRVGEFEDARRRLQVSKLLPTGERRDQLQEQGRAKLRDIYKIDTSKDFAPGGQHHELSPEHGEYTLDERAQRYIKLADTLSAEGLIANSWMTKSVNGAAAFLTTFAAIPMFTISNVPHLMTVWFLALTHVVVSAWENFAIHFLGRKSPARDFVKEKIKAAAQSLRGGCQVELSEAI